MVFGLFVSFLQESKLLKLTILERAVDAQNKKAFRRRPVVLARWPRSSSQIL
jgi:hypothetical protein